MCVFASNGLLENQAAQRANDVPVLWRPRRRQHVHLPRDMMPFAFEHRFKSGRIQDRAFVDPTDRMASVRRLAAFVVVAFSMCTSPSAISPSAGERSAKSNEQPA